MQTLCPIPESFVALTIFLLSSNRKTLVAKLEWTLCPEPTIIPVLRVLEVAFEGNISESVGIFSTILFLVFHWCGLQKKSNQRRLRLLQRVQKAVIWIRENVTL